MNVRDQGPQDPGVPPPKSHPSDPEFLPETLDQTVIAVPLLRDFEEEKREAEERERAGQPPSDPRLYRVIIDLNYGFKGGPAAARERVEQLVAEVIASQASPAIAGSQGVHSQKGAVTPNYVFATLEGSAIRELARRDRSTSKQQPRAIHRIWPDFEVRALINRSVSTVKADALRASFAAMGDGIVWAVMDSGISESHPHFKQHKNLDVGPHVEHRDFTGQDGDACKDEFGHGTHVAGIIAGELRATEKRPIRAFERHRDEEGNVTYEPLETDVMSGMAPRTKLVSLKVLDDKGGGHTSNLIAAIAYIQEVNGYGRRLRIHGVNMSVGYDFEPEWFACGQSPLCREVDRLVRSGVVVVVAAGNTGWAYVHSTFRGPVASGTDLTINDPGNAELAITVGSTHRDSPHTYGVSYFSSKGPTGDGRPKPDLVAPGEKILSCAAGSYRDETEREVKVDSDYIDRSGTSMAAPHVSGVIAAFLSARREFMGQPEAVKRIFLSTATDLRRDRYFQGHGLVDAMRAMQSV